MAFPVVVMRWCGSARILSATQEINQKTERQKTKNKGRVIGKGTLEDEKGLEKQGQRISERKIERIFYYFVKIPITDSLAVLI